MNPVGISTELYRDSHKIPMGMGIEILFHGNLTNSRNLCIKLIES